MNAALCARVGRDDFGDFLVAELQKAGVATELVIRDDDLRTGITVSLSGREDRAFVTYVGTIDSLTKADVPDALIQRARHIHIGSYFLQRKLQPDIPGIFAAARDVGTTTSLDTGYDPYEEWDGGLVAALANVDVFLPNEVEARALARTDDPLAGARSLATVAGQVVLKLGADGSVLVDGARETSMAAFEVDVVDTTCCGDAFNAGFLHAMLDRRPPEERLRWGNAAGAIVAGGSGTSAQMLSHEAIEELIAR